MASLAFTLFVSLGIPALMLAGGYAVGKTVENRHFKSLETREAQLASITCCNLKTVANSDEVSNRFYVDAQAVIGSDYFKTFAMKIRGIFGGELHAMQTVMQRARREALVRMCQTAHDQGATHIYNIRLETSTIGRGTGNRGLPTAEVHVYGTAIRYHST
ncbi:MAG: hypothetical protein COA73_04365 [Candidatus Hydrogenedentota bacterium]|nr:MAG: hypothetical protein COA73_04365 [Candidatus Hydrogenedentota bacterium]